MTVVRTWAGERRRCSCADACADNVDGIHSDGGGVPLRASDLQHQQQQEQQEQQEQHFELSHVPGYVPSPNSRSRPAFLKSESLAAAAAPATSLGASGAAIATAHSMPSSKASGPAQAAAHASNITEFDSSGGGQDAAASQPRAATLAEGLQVASASTDAAALAHASSLDQNPALRLGRDEDPSVIK
jgi:hypothetical protein